MAEPPELKKPYRIIDTARSKPFIFTQVKFFDSNIKAQGLLSLPSMGKVAIVNLRTGQSEVFDTEKDCIKLTLRLVETGAVYQPTPSRELLAKLTGDDNKKPRHF